MNLSCRRTEHSNKVILIRIDNKLVTSRTKIKRTLNNYCHRSLQSQSKEVKTLTDLIFEDIKSLNFLLLCIKVGVT